MKQLLQQKILFKVLFWLWGLTIFTLSSLPNIPTQKINIWDEPFRLDYLEHFGVFFIWGGFLLLWIVNENGKVNWSSKYLYIFGSFIFAALDEIHQIWIPGRSFNPLDLMYNELGLIAAFFLIPLYLKQFYKK